MSPVSLRLLITSWPTVVCGKYAEEATTKRQAQTTNANLAVKHFCRRLSASDMVSSNCKYGLRSVGQVCEKAKCYTPVIGVSTCLSRLQLVTDPMSAAILPGLIPTYRSIPSSNRFNSSLVVYCARLPAVGLCEWIRRVINQEVLRGEEHHESINSPEANQGSRWRYDQLTA